MSRPGWFDWVLDHKALAALFVVLLTMVPLLPKYELVDADGRGIEFYKKSVCQFAEEKDVAGTCLDTIDYMFREQLSISGYSEDKQPVIPGFFYRRKVYRFEYSQQAFLEEYRRLYIINRSFKKEYDRSYGVKE